MKRKHITEKLCPKHNKPISGSMGEEGKMQDICQQCEWEEIDRVCEERARLGKIEEMERIKNMPGVVTILGCEIKQKDSKFVYPLYIKDPKMVEQTIKNMIEEEQRKFTTENVMMMLKVLELDLSDEERNRHKKPLTKRIL
ncbi:MAG: hypothetical protein A3J83_05060 [Elusimicrobia bacterium RIFOXYA2_FULL_40_6]|nr:MAG: hypothetical protein A3J83_05060 [Elusimicrobia bacterium RIFOXYA2_FULL_40_6]